MEHLQLHQGRWRYRRRWPKDVKQLADSGVFFIKALGTSDRQEAKRLRASIEMEFNAKVDSLRRKLEGQAKTLSANEVISLVSRWYREAHNEMKSEYLAVRLNEYERNERKELYYRHGENMGPYDYGDDQSAHEVARKLLADAGADVDYSGGEYKTLVNLVEAGIFELARQGNLLSFQQEYDGPQDSILRAALEGQQSGKPNRTVSDLIEAYKGAEGADWSPSTVDDFQPIFRVIKDALGATSPLESINRDVAREVYTLFKSLPRNMNKRRDMKGLTIAEAVERGRQLDLPTISPNTFKHRYMNLLKAIFIWAENEGWIDKSPFRGLRVIDPVASANKRDPFTTEQLKTLFGASPWQPRNDSPNGKPARYWLPILALFHGFRLAEVGGLQIDDVQEEEGIPVIKVRTNHVRRLKTDQSQRTIPIHSKVIELGFLNYVASQKLGGQERLFPDALAKERGKVGYNVSLWFNRYVKSLGLTGRNLTFHSLRHSFEDRLREADLHGTAIGQYLGGRAARGVEASYGAGFSTNKLKEAIERVEYPSINLGQ